MKYYLAFTIGFGAILGWNAFLITRDNKLFKAYYHDKAMVEYCQQSHPECK